MKDLYNGSFMPNTSNVIAFTKVCLPFGWLGNMSPYPVTYLEKKWPTTEALFQAMRFEDENIREEIRRQKSPMTAKMKAKRFANQMVIEPRSAHDVQNMRVCLQLKIDQHPNLKVLLLATEDALIIEDTTARPRPANLFWGAKRTDVGWEGTNALGKMWMEMRDTLRKQKNP